MLKNKLFAIILLTLLFLPLVLEVVRAQEVPGLPAGLGENPEEYIEQYKNKTLTKWDYLGKEWKSMLLKNKYIGKADSIFSKFSIVFKILFNMDYSLSITLFVIVILWLFFAFESGRLLQKWLGIESNFLALLIGVGIAMILAQLNFLLLITKMTGWLVYAKKAWWWHVLMIVLIIGLFALIYFFNEAIIKWLEERRKKQIEEEGELTIQKIKAWWKGFIEAKTEPFRRIWEIHKEGRE